MLSLESKPNSESKLQTATFNIFLRTLAGSNSLVSIKKSSSSKKYYALHL